MPLLVVMSLQGTQTLELDCLGSNIPFKSRNINRYREKTSGYQREEEEELEKKKQLEKDQPKCATDDWIKKMWYT